LGRVVVGVVAGLLIGAVAAVMGVAGGEPLIPTIVLLYGLDIKVAGSLSMAVALPPMLAAFARYGRDGSFDVLRQSGRFVALMACGSVASTVSGGLLMGAVPSVMIIPLLATSLVGSPQGLGPPA